MREFKRMRSARQDVSRFFWGIGAVLLLGGLTFLAARATWNMYGKFSEAAHDDAEAQAQLSSLETQEAAMTAAVRDLSSPRGVEAQLRERYGVVKPGEGVIEIIEPATTSAPVSPPQPTLLTRIWQAMIP